MITIRTQKRAPQVPPAADERTEEAPPAPVGQDAAEHEAELRRQMYERIARGHALMEAEEAARRKWRGR